MFFRIVGGGRESIFFKVHGGLSMNFDNIDWSGYGLDELLELYSGDDDSKSDRMFENMNDSTVKEDSDWLADGSKSVYDLYAKMDSFGFHFSDIMLPYVDSDISDELEDDESLNDIKDHKELYDKIDGKKAFRDTLDKFKELYSDLLNNDDHDRENFKKEIASKVEPEITDRIEKEIENALEYKEWVGMFSSHSMDVSSISISTYCVVDLVKPYDADGDDSFEIRVSDHDNQHGECDVEVSLLNDYGGYVDEFGLGDNLMSGIGDWIEDNVKG